MWGNYRCIYLWFIDHFLPIFLLPVLGFSNTTFYDSNFSAVGIVLGNMAQYLLQILFRL